MFVWLLAVVDVPGAGFAGVSLSGCFRFMWVGAVCSC